jgi:hypothetical protein
VGTHIYLQNGKAEKESSVEDDWRGGHTVRCWSEGKSGRGKRAKTKTEGLARGRERLRQQGTRMKRPEDRPASVRQGGHQSLMGSSTRHPGPATFR